MLLNINDISDFYKGLSAAFAQGLDEVPDMSAMVADTVQASGKSIDLGWVEDFPSLRLWTGDKQIKNLKAGNYIIEIDPYEATVGIDRHDIEDAMSMGGVTAAVAGESRVATLAAKAAARWKQKLIFDLLAAGASTLGPDGQNFFSTTHSANGSSVANYDATGGGNPWFLLDTNAGVKPVQFVEREAPHFKSTTRMHDVANDLARQVRFSVEARGAVGFGFWQTAYCSLNTLNATNFDAYMAAMLAYESDEGGKLGIMPNLLVCGPSNRAAARALLKKELDASGESNENYNEVDLLVVPWLT